MNETVVGAFLVTYAVVQTIVFLFLIRFTDLYEREPISALAMMALWGAAGATALSALGNAGLSDVLPPDIEFIFGRAIYVPIVEELAKGLALVAFVILSVKARGRFGIPYFEGPTDGIVYGAAVGLGFAFTEDVLYLLLGVSQEGAGEGIGTYLSRRDFFDLSMLHHAIYSAAFGVGLGVATWSRRMLPRITFPVLGLLVAVLLHAINNGLVRFVLYLKHGLQLTAAYLSGVLDSSDTATFAAEARDLVAVVRVIDFAVIAVFALLVLLWLRYQRRVISEELAEEAETGLISHTELDLLPRYWLRSRWYWQLIRTGQWERWRLLKRIHNELVDLALLKRRSSRGRVSKDEIESSRRLIAKLKAQKAVFLG
jgi:RsiW-degrading membrane proteinase PrsW (M82 family)